MSLKLIVGSMVLKVFIRQENEKTCYLILLKDVALMGKNVRIILIDTLKKKIE